MIRFKYKYVSLILCTLLYACTGASETESRLYKQIFAEEKAMFRGINLGDKLDNIHENMQAKYTDILGVVYEIPLSANEKMSVHYYIDNLQTNKETNRIATIQANITVNDEVETTQLYHQIQQHLTQKYGLPTGNYGTLKWESAAYGMEVSLNIASNRKEIDIAFINVK